MSDITERVQRIIEEKLGVDASEVKPEATFTNDLGADSLDTVELIMERAKKYNVPTLVFNRSELRDPEKMLHQLQADGIDFIILAGFLWLMPACITAAFPNRIINIHPALLPAYGGKGMYGHHVHEAVIAAGEKESGITIHYVNDHYDQGAIIFQAKCPVLPTDTPDDLAARVHELEYRYFPQIIEETILKQEV